MLCVSQSMYLVHLCFLWSARVTLPPTWRIMIPFIGSCCINLQPPTTLVNWSDTAKICKSNLLCFGWVSKKQVHQSDLCILFLLLELHKSFLECHWSPFLAGHCRLHGNLLDALFKLSLKNPDIPFQFQTTGSSCNGSVLCWSKKFKPTTVEIGKCSMKLPK